MTRLAHFFQMAVASSLLGSGRADDCQFLEIEQSFYYNFFGVSHSATTRSKVHCSRVHREQMPHQLFSPEGGGEALGVPVPDSSSLTRSGDPTLEFSLPDRFASKFDSTTTAASTSRVEWKSS